MRIYCTTCIVLDLGEFNPLSFHLIYFPLMIFLNENALSDCWYFLKIIYLFILFLVALSLLCSSGALSGCGERGLLSVVVHRLLSAVTSLVAEHRL